MDKQSYSVSILADAAPQLAFDYINNVSAWWTTDLEGQSANLNDSFTVRFDDVHISTQKVVELAAARRVVWLVTDCQINFVSDKREWLNTRIVFEIIPRGNQTEIRFSHEGLDADLECFSACSNAWADYIIESLLPLINTGQGKPGGNTL